MQIGHKLMRCETRPVTTIEPIHCRNPVVNRYKLNKDQKYFLCFCLAIKTGNWANELYYSGFMFYSRWLTKSKYTLTLLKNTESPSYELKVTVNFITKSYMSVWFRIKVNRNFMIGPIRVYSVIETLLYLLVNLKLVVHPVI